NKVESRPGAATPSEISFSIQNGKALAIYVGTELIQPDLVFGWVSLQARETGLALLQAFEKAGVPVINRAEVLSTGQSKLINSIVLHRHGCHHADTVVVTNEAALDKLIPEIGLPCVVKPLIGAKGMDVRLIDNADELWQYARLQFAHGGAVYLQRELAKPGRDIRVRVIDYQAVFAFYRYLSPDGFTTNLSTGGSWQSCKLTEEMKAVAERCARLMQAPVCGVDLIELQGDRYSVIEVNTTPAFSWPNDDNVEDVCRLIEKYLDAVS
ncbi:ATP-grasp domain-containing protein, partial [Pectobacterium aquaticum]|uniref:ATP-grasp domain-containing protein n=1 Tax=Pectobacterium aquaticum TaxID=2204145 RepID=UPI001F0E854C